jgi:hypothetical protein
MKSNSNIKPTTNSNLHSFTQYIFNNNIKNYENINNKELKSLNLKDRYIITEIRKNINIRKNEIKEVFKQIELYTRKEILLPPPPPKEKTKEEIEDEIEADLLRFRYQTYQPNTSYKGKKNDFLLQIDKGKEFNLIK